MFLEGRESLPLSSTGFPGAGLQLGSRVILTFIITITLLFLLLLLLVYYN